MGCWCWQLPKEATYRCTIPGPVSSPPLARSRPSRAVEQIRHVDWSLGDNFRREADGQIWGSVLYGNFSVIRSPARGRLSTARTDLWADRGGRRAIIPRGRRANRLFDQGAENTGKRARQRRFTAR